MSKGAEEAEPAGVMESDQPSEEEPPEQLAEHAHRSRKAGRDEIHRLASGAMPPRDGCLLAIGLAHA